MFGHVYRRGETLVVLEAMINNKYNNNLEFTWMEYKLKRCSNKTKNVVNNVDMPCLRAP